MPSSFFANSPSVINRYSRKFPLPRHSRPTATIATILIPTLCLTLLLLPAPNFSTLQLPDSPIQQTRSNHTLTDYQIAASARRARQLPPCASASKRADTFLMVFMGHSGSTAIITELRSHSQLHIQASELVDHQDVFNTTEALQMTKHFFDKGIANGKTPGFKIRPNHILNQPEQFRQLVKQYNTRILWQYRQNIFKASIGEYAARYLNDTRAVEGLKQDVSQEEKCKHESGCSFRVDSFEFLHNTLKQKVNSHHLIASAVNVLSSSTGCVREVPYEDYLYDREGVMRDIEKFLGLTYEETKPERFKATGDNMCSVVENWDEVCTAFYGCISWQHMMDDAKNRCFCDYTTGPVKYCDAELRP